MKTLWRTQAAWRNSVSSEELQILTVVLLLLGMGLVTIYSSSSIFALERFGSSTYFLLRQAMWIALGLTLTFFFSRIDCQKLKAWVWPVLLTCVGLLLAVLVVGHRVGGAKRWLRLGPVGFQPSELAKFAVILFVAYYCDKHKSRLGDFKSGLLPALAVVGLVCGLIFIQPDLGTPFVILTTAVVMLFVAGAKFWHFASLVLAAVPALTLAIWFEPYRRKRWLAFLNPWENVQGASYQLVQSILAMGSGGLAGVGPGQSRSKLLYLPEPHTDFIFPIFAEEWGWLGAVTLLVLFAYFALKGFRAALASAHMFTYLLAFGITFLISFQALFNLGVVTGLLPTKGLPLPFVSFGGSSLAVTLAEVGILLSLARRS